MADFDSALVTETTSEVSETAPIAPIKAEDVVAPPEEAAPVRDDSRTEEVLNIVDDHEEQERTLQSPPTSADDDENNDEDWKELMPPPKAEDEEKEDMDDIDEPVKPPPDDTLAEVQAATSFTGRTSQLVQPVESEEEPDFSKYKTHVAERLWRAQRAADKSGLKSSPELVPLTKEYQKQRKKMANLMRAADDYRDAMRVLAEKKSKVRLEKGDDRACRRVDDGKW
jgi:hypothetical protein